MTNETWRSDNENASDVRIISNKGLESITLAAITAAMTTFTEPGTTTINLTLRLRVNHQPAINLRRFFSLKHNQTHEGKF